MKRRAFLRSVGTATGALALGSRPLFADPADPSRRLLPHASGLPRRVLGRTGREISIAGFPGLALSKIDQAAANAAVRAAFDRGVNYFDVAPAYGDAELKLGPALLGLPRDELFLASKTKKRDAAGARTELERSLVRLGTDRLDLYQLHVMSTKAEVEQVFGPGGAMETLRQARQEGKVRWLGFSAHTREAALDILARYRFETLMYPVNFIEHFTHRFDPEVLALARQRECAVLSIKAISAGAWNRGETRTRNNWWYRVLEEQSEIDLAVRFALSLDPVVSVVPTSFVDLAEKSIDAAVRFQPATEADLSALRELAAKYVPLFPRSPSYVGRTGPHARYFEAVG